MNKEFSSVRSCVGKREISISISSIIFESNSLALAAWGYQSANQTPTNFEIILEKHSEEWIVMELPGICGHIGKVG